MAARKNARTRPDVNSSKRALVSDGTIIDLGPPEPEFQTRASVAALERAHRTHKDRAAVYKRNDKVHGMVMAALYPDGVTLLTSADHARFGLVTQLVSKLTRYTLNFSAGGHLDSVHDMIVYAAMLEGIDSEIRG